MKAMITEEDVYKKAQENFGIVPGIIKEIAKRSTAVAYLYTEGSSIMHSTGLTEMEINAIELKFSKMNSCESCVKGHTYLVKKAGMSDEDVHAILKNELTTDKRINTLTKAAEYIYHSGTDTYPEIVLNYFENEEITEQEIFEIIGLLSLKTISNYINNYLKSKK